MIRTGLLALAVIGATACRDRAAPRAPAPPARIEVRVDAPGMAALDVEATVVRPLEHALQAVAGARHVTADAREGFARIVIEVDGAGDAAAAAVRDRVAGVGASLPAEVGAPRIHVAPAGTRVHVGVTGDVDPALLAAAAERLARELERTPGVAAVEVCAPREVAVVEVDPHRLRALGVPARDVERAIVGTNQARPAGDEPFDALRNLVIPTLGGAPVRLGDVAVIRLEHDTRGCVARTRRGAAASLAIAAHDPARLPELAEIVDAAARDLPPGVRARRFAHTLEARLVAGTAREDAVALAVRLLDGDGIVEVGIEAAPCAGAGTFARVHADAAPSTLAVAIPGIASVAHPGDPAVARWWIAGDDLDELRRIALDHAARIDGTDGLSAVAIVDEPAPELVVDADRDRLAALGVSMGELSEQLRFALDERDVGDLVTDRGVTPVRLRFGAPTRDRRLDEVVVTAADGQAVPLHAVATIREDAQPRAICRRDGARAIAIDVRGDVTDAAARRVVEAELPAGYRWIAP